MSPQHYAETVAQQMTAAQPAHSPTAAQVAIAVQPAQPASPEPESGKHRY